MSDVEDVVWQNTVDGGTWDCRVVHSSEHTGTLYVTRIATGEVIFERVVGLAYGAIFGPDVDDVQRWEGMSITAIDDATGSLSEPEGNQE